MLVSSARPETGLKRTPTGCCMNEFAAMNAVYATFVSDPPPVQMLLPGGGRWVGALHPVNAFLILFMYGWLFYTLRKEGAAETAPAGLIRVR